MLSDLGGLFNAVIPHLSLLPLYLVWLLGFLLAIIYREHNPPLCTALMVCFGYFLIANILFTVLNQWLIHWMVETASADRSLFYGIVAMARSLLSAVVWAILLFAVIRWGVLRQEKNKEA